MILYGKGIKGSKDFTTNGKFKSLLLGLKDIDKVDSLAIGLSMMSLILGYSYENKDISVNNRLSMTSKKFLNLNKTRSYKKW